MEQFQPLEEITIDLNPSIPALPKVADKTKLDVRYVLISPYAFAHIYWDRKNSELRYDLEEPLLGDEEKAILDSLEENMRDVININVLVERTPEAMIEYIDKTARLLISELDLKVTDTTYKKIFYYLFRDFIGLNEIEALTKDYFIEDIECNGVDSPVYIIHRIYRNIKTNIIYKDIDKLASFVEKIAQRAGKYISYANPLLDGSLPDGSLDYNEPFVYKENGIVKISKIGKFVDRFYKEDVSNVPVKVDKIEVPYFNKETLKIEWKEIDYVYRHKNKEELYKLELEFGRSVVLTGAHSLFILTKNGIKAEKTSNINKDSYVVIPLKIPENDVIKGFNLAKELAKSVYYKKIVIGNVPFSLFEEKKLEIKRYLEKNYKNPYETYYELRKKGILPIRLWEIIPEDMLRKCKIKTTSPVSIPAYLSVSNELLRLLGYYIAEGWTMNIKAHKRLQFCLNKKEKNLIDDIKNCFRKCFDADIYVEPEKNNAVKLTLNSLLVWLVFNEVLKVSHYAKEKEVPEIVLNVNKELQKEFLKAWHLGDFGSTASEKLATDISYLSLFDNKIVPFYDRVRESCIDSRNIKSHEFYTNFFSRNISNFPPMIPIEVLNPLNQTHYKFRNKKISRERLRKILKEMRYKRFVDLNSASDKFLKEWEKRGFLKNKTLTEKGEKLIKDISLANKLINSDLGFVKIKKIERVKPSSEFVYDVSVPGHENFIGGVGGVMCHNSRINATYTKDITSKGPTFTLRKFTKLPWTPIQLLSFNTLSPEMLAYFWLLIQYKSNILITGSTASGKTTLLNALAFFIPPEARVVSIEDTREIHLPRENWLPSVARTAIGMGNIGEVDLFALLKNSFRQNPDYVIVGEVRGKEAFVLFQGMASGHSSISTMHADSVDTVIKRLETPPIELSPTLVNTLDCVAIMTHAIVKKDQTRRLRSIVEIVKVNPDGVALTNTPFVWNVGDDRFYYKKSSKVFEKIGERYGLTQAELLKEFSLRARLIYQLYRKGIFGFNDVQQIINEYYKSPEKILEKFGVAVEEGQQQAA